jgi:hypothetical protein
VKSQLKRDAILIRIVTIARRFKTSGAQYFCLYVIDHLRISLRKLLLTTLYDNESATPIRRRLRRQGGGNGKRGVHKLRNGPSTVGNA